MKLLVVANVASRAKDLQKRLLETAGEQLEVECLDSTKNVRDPVQISPYDLVIWDSADACSVTAGACVDLAHHPNEPTIRQIIETAACKCNKCTSGSCLALAILSAIEKYRDEKQRQTIDEILRKLRRTVEQSPDLVMICNRSGVLEYVNTAFEKLTGYERNEVIGQPLGMLKSEQEPGELYEEMWNTVLSGQPFNGTVVNRKKNGESFILEKVITPLKNPEGAITHFISTGRDVTDEKKLQSELQQSQKMEAIGRLAGGVAHDFNNLLMVISGYGELALESLPAENDLRPKVAEIVSASRRAADLTRQLLAFGRKQMQSLRLLDLNTELADIRRMLPRLIGEDIRFEFVPGKGLKPVKADPVQIEQIVINLAVNARDAMPKGGELRVETRNVHLDQTYREKHAIVPAGDYVLLQVSDTGIGIAAEHLPHIFEPFYTTKDEGKGTGLGLATVYGIVKQNGGFIWVYSEPKLGTTFKIYLPLAESGVLQASPPSGHEGLPRGSETILLVEDEAAVRQCTREFLTSQGYTVLEAVNGEEALKVSRAYCGPIQLMLTDVVMPRMSGPKVAEQLAAERPQMKILFASGYAESTVLRHGKIDVTAQFIEKPFSLSALARKIHDALAGNAKANAASSSV